MFNFSNWFFGNLCLGSNFDFLRKTGQLWANIFICLRGFLGQISIKNLSLYSWEITRKFFCKKMLKNFNFSTFWIWLFGIFDKHPQGCNEIKTSMGLLQGFRLRAWTTKSPIQGNHWVPWGCRAHLGSVKGLVVGFGLKGRPGKGQ